MATSPERSQVGQDEMRMRMTTKLFNFKAPNLEQIQEHEPRPQGADGTPPVDVASDHDEAEDR
jgi:hypothetical protein